VPSKAVVALLGGFMRRKGALDRSGNSLSSFFLRFSAGLSRKAWAKSPV
jgi:hypothetical protein